MRKKKLWPRGFALVLALALAGSPAFPQTAPTQAAQPRIDPFYLKLLQEGEQYYAAQRYADAVKALDVATFGLVEEPKLMAKALGYLSLSHFNLKNDLKAKDSIVRLVDLVGLPGIDSLSLNEQDRSYLSQIAAYYKLDQPAGQAPAPRTETLTGARPAAPGTTPAKAPAKSGGKPPKPLSRVQELEAQVKAQPKNPQVYLDLYDYRLQQKDPKGARKALQALSDKVPGDSRGPSLLGKFYYGQKDFKAAAESLERAVALLKASPDMDKDQAEARCYLILSYNSLKKKPQVEKACREFLARFGRDDIAATGLSDNDKAQVQLLLDSLKPEVIPPGVLPAPVGAGSALSAKPAASQTTAPSASALEKGIKSNPKDVSLYYGLYDLYRQKKDWASAKQTLETLVRSNPAEAKAYLELGRLRYQDREYGKAASALAKLFTLPPNVSLSEDIRTEASFYLALSQFQDNSRAAARETYSANRPALEAFVAGHPDLPDSVTAVWRSLTQDAGDSGQATILGLRVDRSGQDLEIRIDVSGLGTYRTFVLSKERSVVIEIFHVAGIRAPERTEVNSQGIKTIRCVPYQDSARIILEWQNRIPSHRIQRTETGLSIIVEQSRPES